MTSFNLLPLWSRLILAGILFLATLLTGALVSYEIILPQRKKRILPDGLFFVLYLLILSYVTALASESQRVIRFDFPWLLIPAVCLAAFVYGTVGLRKNYLVYKNTISPVSIKQAFDNLNSGICFSDERDRIILINYTLGELLYPLLGFYPQTLEEVKSALEKAEKIRSEEDRPSIIYRFSDGRVWQFLFVALSDNSLDGFTQVIAQNVTELYEANKSIERENELLRITNEKITDMLDILSDRIRQQETLALKMRVHNDIGSSLIKITRIISGGDDENMETQLKLLRSAVGYFATGKDFSVMTLEEVVSGAEEMNVKINFFGEKPKSGYVSRLLALALRECVTNCVRHASGDTVNVKITQNEKDCFVSITNNGKIPESEIVEGGGLSSLRRRVEQAGGEMRVLHFPVFELQLHLMNEEANYGV